VSEIYQRVMTDHRPRRPPEGPSLTYRGVNALAESFIGLYKSECIFHEGPWSGVETVEWATLTYFD
jgi:hypothetical protein